MRICLLLFFLNDDDVYVAELMVLPYGVYPF